jgi:hypothetical protein
MTKQYPIGFQEATVLNFVHNDNNVILNLEDVIINEKRRDAIITCHQVSKIQIDEKTIDNPLMAAPDGEILSLEVSKEGLKAIIEWNDFENHDSFIHSYNIDCKFTKVEII